MTFLKLNNLPTNSLFSGFTGKLIHTENLTLGYWQIAKGSVLPEHSHIHEQVTHVLSGKLELTISGETQIVESGIVAVIPSNAKHSAIAITDCMALDVFTPVREDYKLL
jgi:quercetin dioxygenase-like cupin family protein